MKIFKLIKNKYIIIICFLIFIYVIINMYSNNIITVNSVPTTDKVIVLDAGHGLPDKGAVRLI